MLFISKSWLTESVTNSMLDCSHCYTIYRKHCPHQQCGGIVIGTEAKGSQLHSIPLPSKFVSIEIVAF